MKKPSDIARRHLASQGDSKRRRVLYSNLSVAYLRAHYRKGEGPEGEWRSNKVKQQWKGNAAGTGVPASRCQPPYM